MKRYLKNALFLLVLICTMGMLPQLSAQAAKTTLVNVSDDIDYGEYYEDSFYLSKKSVVYFDLNGTDEDMKFTVKNEDGDTVYSFTTYDPFWDEMEVEHKVLPSGWYDFKLKDNNDWLSYCNYHIVIKYTPYSECVTQSVKLDKTSLKLAVGKSETLKATVTPSKNNLDKAGAWKSSKSGVAKVSEKGKVTAKALGQTTVSFKRGTKSGKCKVTVNKGSVTVAKGFTKSMSSLTKYLPDSTKWKVKDTEIAKVSNGKITGKKVGSTTLTAKVDGVKYEIKVSVKKPVTMSVSYIDDTDIYNEVGIKFKNNTHKKIVYMTLNIYQYNNAGRRLESPYDYYYVNDDLKAGDTDVWEFWVNDDTKKVKLKLTKVEFSDGTTWKP